MPLAEMTNSLFCRNSIEH